MQELQAIFWQRNTDITLLKQQQRELKKQDFQERQRMRAQRQNWIIKIIKTIKNYTNQYKKSLYQCVLRMMAYYGENQKICKKEDIDWEKNFTQEIINLFVVFYNIYGFADNTVIKKIVRPNNAYIVVDLIKQLVETHRQYFKVKLQEAYKQLPKSNEDKSKLKMPSMILSRKQIPTQVSQPQEYKKESVLDSLQLHGKINQVMLEKWNNYVSYNLPNQKQLKQQINDTYCQLLQRNSNNRFMVTKFQQKCFGKSRSFLYNISSLYTQQQIKAMQQKVKYQISQKYSNIKQLHGNPSAQQLKQYFKIKIQIQQNIDKLQSNKFNNKTVNKWVPLVIQKSVTQNQPLNLYVLFGDEMYEIRELFQKCGIGFKNYLKNIIKNKIDQLNAKQYKDNLELKNFKRHHFIDINHAKKKQLMTDQHRVYDKSKKQSIFPILRSNQLRQQTQIALKNRSMSQYKLAPLFKNQTINRKFQYSQTQQQSPSYPSMQVFKNGQIMCNQKSIVTPVRSKSKLNISSETKDIDKDRQQLQRQKQSWIKLKLKDRSNSINKIKKTKIDNIIDMIINQRNLTVTN